MEKYNHYSRLVARVYDPMLHYALKKIRQDVAAEVKNSGSRSVIDLCCGTGKQLVYLRNAGIRKVAGVDISENMLSQARRNGVEHLCFMMDASETNFANSSFDSAILSFVLHETREDMAFALMSEAIRIVRRNGKIIIVDYNTDSKAWFPGKIMTHAVERVAGGNHYSNYRNYMKTRLPVRLFKGLRLKSAKRYFFGSVKMLVFENTKPSLGNTDLQENQ
jgi:ubiquinone/menaquinone biosynthesis C-methylase UbiE